MERNRQLALTFASEFIKHYRPDDKEVLNMIFNLTSRLLEVMITPEDATHDPANG